MLNVTWPNLENRSQLFRFSENVLTAVLNNGVIYRLLRQSVKLANSFYCWWLLVSGGEREVIYTTLFSTKNGKYFMRFGRSFTQQRVLGGLKTQTFENGFQSASTVFENDTVIMCKLQKIWICENGDVTCMHIMCSVYRNTNVHRRIVFLYKVTSPTTGQAWKIVLLVIFVDPCEFIWTELF